MWSFTRILFRPILFLLYINDILLASEFDTTLFADDTCYTLADKDLTSLENRVNNRLIYLYDWFLRHKLSIDFGKTNLLISKTPYRPIVHNFKIMISNTFLERAQNVKYFGVYIDELLNWSTYLVASACKIFWYVLQIAELCYQGVFNNALLQYYSQSHPVWSHFLGDGRKNLL